MCLRFTLVSEGSSDRTLLHVLEWLCEATLGIPAQGEWFDPGIYMREEISLRDRVIKALDIFPCDIIFIHRDADGPSFQNRIAEIDEAITEPLQQLYDTPYVCVVPIRMTEAWLLIDEAAIRRASGNPNGTNALNLPSRDQIEQVQNPKKTLFDAIIKASGLSSRRRKKLSVYSCRLRVAECIDDFSPLRHLTAFRRLEEDLSLVREKFQAPAVN